MFGVALLGAALVSYFGNLAGLFQSGRYDGMITMTMFVMGAGLLGLTTGDKPHLPGGPSA